MSESTPMKRAELRVWSAEKLGWANLHFMIGPHAPELYGTAPDYLNLEIGQWDYEAPDPTRESGAAFALKEWFWNTEHDVGGMYSPQQIFAGEWKLSRLYEKSGEELAEWICCAVFFAVEGRRVEVVGD